MSNAVKLAVFATHPVQYHTALWRSLAAVAGLEIHVHYFSDHSVRGGVDPGFGVPVAWDVPLLNGYEHTFLSRHADISKAWGVGLRGAREVLAQGGSDWVLLQGYTHRFERQVLRAAKSLGLNVLLRGELSSVPRGGRLRARVRAAYVSWFFAHVDMFCAIGQMAKQDLEAFGVAPERIVFSPYHVDSALFEALASRFDGPTSRAKLGLDPGRFVLLFSGKLIPRKEPLLLIDALEKVRGLGDVELLVLGDGALREEVLSRGRRVLGDRFHAAGFVNQSELGPYFAAADALVLPSSYETWGLVVNEAMYFGLPSIVSDRVGCRPDLVRPGETGFVFRSGDAPGLTRAIQQMLDDRNQTREMGQRARALVRSYSTEAARDGILRATGFNGDGAADPA